jgi:hypothetical protein
MAITTSEKIPLAFMAVLSALALSALFLVISDCQTPHVVHCSQKVANAVRALATNVGHLRLYVLLSVLISAIALRGLVRLWVFTILIPVSVYVLGMDLSINVVGVSCVTTVIGDEDGVCY